MALRDLAVTFRSLSPCRSPPARQIPARPSDSGSGNYTAPQRSFRRFCNGPPFCVHWVTSTVDAPSPTDTTPADGKPDWINRVIEKMTEVWNEEITTLGYRKPRADKPTGGHRGGNPNTKIDIFIQDVGRPRSGSTATARRTTRGSKGRDVSAYCVLDDDYSASQFPSGANGIDALKVTAAHEFHHASQFAYDWKEDRGMMEATATNMMGGRLSDDPGQLPVLHPEPADGPEHEQRRPLVADRHVGRSSRISTATGSSTASSRRYVGSPTHPQSDPRPRDQPRDLGEGGRGRRNEQGR